MSTKSDTVNRLRIKRIKKQLDKSEAFDDLLEACKAAVADWDDPACLGCHSVTVASMNRIKAAIAKAEGK